jgi:DNA recombination protein RmuC
MRSPTRRQAEVAAGACGRLSANTAKERPAMDYAIVTVATVLALVVALAIVVTRSRSERERLAVLAREIGEERARTDTARNEATQRLADKIAAESRLVELQRQLTALTAERAAAAGARDAALAAEAAAAREAAVMRQRLGDFERLKEESLKSAQAAVLETAQLVSSKLLADHKRENEEAKKSGQEMVRQTTEQLYQRFEQVTQAVALLKGEVGVSGQQLDTLWRALTSPGGSGRFAEIGLANTLKSFGLVEGRDYILQHTTEDTVTGRRLRPDASVFLPGDSVIVIDCKASKFLVEIAQAVDAEAEAAAQQNLARSMNQHLRALAEKDYKSAVATSFREAGHGDEITRILSVMYLPNEGTLERLHLADPDFVVKAARHQIVPVGPAGLAGFIGFASVEISLIRQIENQQEIVRGTEMLLDSLAIALGHAASVGKGIKGAAEAYERFSRSVNGRLLGRSRKLAELGLRPGKPMPGNLPSYRVDVLDSIIEGDLEEIGETPPEIAVFIKQAGE